MRSANLNAHEKHRRSLRYEHDREKILHLTEAQSFDLRIGTRSLGAAIPAIVGVGAIAVFLVVGFIVLIVVRHEIMEREAVVAGGEGDSAVGSPYLSGGQVRSRRGGENGPAVT